MKETIESISDFTKFLIMLIIYTGYLTWWAASVSAGIDNNSKYIVKNSNLIEEQGRLDSENTIQTIKLVEKVSELDAKTKTHEALLSNIVEQHIRCSILLEQIMDRVSNSSFTHNSDHNNNNNHE